MSRYTHLLLDLDDTLYPGTCGVWEAVRDRIQRFIETRLSITQDQAALLRRRYLEQFGTTLAGLIAEYDVDIDEYLSFVHDVPIESLISPDPDLEQMLASIPIPRIIFTNAYRPHAERVLRRLGVLGQIDQVIDIYALGLINKPRLDAYHQALRLISCTQPSGVIFVDDRLANLEPAAGLKMITVLVGPPPEANTHLHIENIRQLTRLLPGLTDDLSRGSDD